MALGPSIVVRVFGELTQLQTAFAKAAGQAKSGAEGIHTAFSGVLGALNQTGVLGPFSGALAGVDAAIQTIGEHADHAGLLILGIGGAMAAVGAGLSAVGSKEAASHQQLQAAVGATGKDYDDYAKQVDAAIKRQEGFGHSSAETQDALRALTQATGDPGKALQYLGTASDLAAAKHESLTTAAGQLGKTYNGAGRLLKEFGVDAAPKATAATKGLETATRAAQSADAAAGDAKQKLADLQARLSGKTHLSIADQQHLRDAEQKVVDTSAKARDAHGKLAAAQDGAGKAAAGQADTMDALSKKLSGQASQAADTFTGHLNAVKAKLEDTVASIGQKYGPAITTVGTLLAGLGGAWEVISAVMAADWFAAFWPVALIVAAIAAVGVAIYLLYRNWDKVWGFIKAIVMDVWHWIEKNWPMLLAILLGPITAAAYFFWKFFGADIEKWVGDAIAWIKGAWNGLVGFFSGVIGSIGRIIGGIWHVASDAAGTVVATIKGAWNGLVDFFVGLPGRIGHPLSGMWSGFVDSFKGAINTFIGLWNSFHTPSVDILGVKTPSVGLPHINPLAAGGIVTGPTLALLGERGPEAVIPLNQARTGPAVVIQQASFATEMDVDLFMRRVAWSVQARAV